jgi:alcohol dehydrogenase YqhD (iron-dependent ADH family)
MENFNFRNGTEIIFGKGRENEVGKYASKYGKTVLLHYGGGSIKKTGLYDKVVKSLNDNGLKIIELPGVKPNPRLSLIQEGIEICRKEKVDLILAVGGGSVIDSSKSIAIGVPYDGDVWDFYTGKAVPKEALPIATILTIPAAGSESSDGNVVTNEDGWFKKAVSSKYTYPQFSILNPELAFTLPKSQIRYGVSDIIAHQFERYFTNVKNVELTDRMLEAVMKTIINNAPKVLKNPNDYDAWSEIMLGGCFGHNNSLGSGRVDDWATHNIEHELSGIYDIAHGEGLAIMFPAWMKYNYKHDIDRFVQFAVRVWNVENDYFDKEKTALAGIAAYEKFLISMELPVRLSEINIGSDRFEEMASKATYGDTVPQGNFVALTQADIVNIYKLAE